MRSLALPRVWTISLKLYHMYRLLKGTVLSRSEQTFNRGMESVSEFKLNTDHYWLIKCSSNCNMTFSCGGIIFSELKTTTSNSMPCWMWRYCPCMYMYLQMHDSKMFTLVHVHVYNVIGTQVDMDPSLINNVLFLSGCYNVSCVHVYLCIHVCAHTCN